MRKKFLSLSIFLSLTVFGALPIFGATITVSNTNDSGPGSLRQAIADAASGDTINFTVTGTIMLTSGTLTIDKDLTISGPGASYLAISGSDAFQVFLVDYSVTTTIAGLTIENGNSSSVGGGIYNRGTLFLTNSTVSGNSASTALGGAGGGILNLGTGTLTVTNSTISGNAAYSGGGIDNAGGMLTVTNSTISGNTAVSGGAGIFTSGTLSVTNTTFANNSLPLEASGAGIENLGTLKVKSTAMQKKSSGGTNCYNVAGGTMTSFGYNLSDDASCTGFTQVTDTNLGLDPSGLQDNGGPTETIALLPTSYAVDAIPLSDCTDVAGNAVTTDQRGVARPQGSACDIGAFELEPVVYLSTHSAKLRVFAGPPPSFTLNASFTLGASSDGIDPLTEDVTLQVGTYRVTIPAGSFKQLTNGKKAGAYAFSGVIGGVTLSLKIAPPSVTGDGWTFKASGTPVDLTGLSNPITVMITIGDDSGTIAVNAIF
jgi:hypothetical protein